MYKLSFQSGFMKQEKTLKKNMHSHIDIKGLVCDQLIPYLLDAQDCGIGSSKGMENREWCFPKQIQIAVLHKFGPAIDFDAHD